MLRLVGERSYKEIAEITGKNIGTVGWLISVGLKALGEGLEPLLEGRKSAARTGSGRDRDGDGLGPRRTVMKLTRRCTNVCALRALGEVDAAQRIEMEHLLAESAELRAELETSSTRSDSCARVSARPRRCRPRRRPP